MVCGLPPTVRCEKVENIAIYSGDAMLTNLSRFASGSLVYVIVSLSMFPVSADQPTGAAVDESTALFDGSGLGAWQAYSGGDVPDGWVVQDGALCRHDGGGDIITCEAFANFELTLEWKISVGGNSGIMYRVATGDAAPYFSGPEYQVLDSHGHADGGSRLTSAGALYGLYPSPISSEKPAGEWNSAKIVVQDDHVEHWLNGQKIVDCEIGSEDWNQRVANSKFATWEKFGKLACGHIALQDHGDKVWYRNIKIQKLAESGDGNPDGR